MPKIKEIKAREIKDSRGKPTVEVELKTEKGSFVASCPSGASTGKNEALELRDADGRGVLMAIKNVNEIIAPKLKGKDPREQKILDELMIKTDDTENKSNLGANAILPVSMAICRAGAATAKLPLYEYIAELAGVRPPQALPLPMFNLLEGGAHAVGRNIMDLQEFMAVPQKKSFSENLIIANKVFKRLTKTIKESIGTSDVPIAMGDLSPTNFTNEGIDFKNDRREPLRSPPSGYRNLSSKLVGDEGGFAPPITKAEQALFLLKNAIGAEDAKIAIDAAASQFFKNRKYVLEGKEYSRQEMLEFYKDLVARFPILSLEDPFAEEDWEGFKFISNIKNQISNILIVGDDLTTTNIKRIKEAQIKHACNGVIIKPNQIGTVSETIDATNLAKSYGWKIMVSHRSGETMDTFIADFAVGVGADFIKSGAPTQQERMVKYNRLLEIENELHKK